MEVKKKWPYANMAVLEDKVFEWVRDYYLTDDREKEAERRTEAEELPQTIVGADQYAEGNKNKTAKKRNAPRKINRWSEQQCI